MTKIAARARSATDGKKTYIFMAGAIAIAIGGVLTNELTAVEAGVRIFEALGFCGARAAIKKGTGR